MKSFSCQNEPIGPNVKYVKDLYETKVHKPGALRKFAYWTERIDISISGIPEVNSCQAKCCGAGAARMVYAKEEQGRGADVIFKFNHVDRYEDHNESEWNCKHQCPDWLIPKVYFYMKFEWVNFR